MTSEQQFQRCLEKAQRVVALVGNGLSAASGLPVFQGSQPLWHNFNMIDLATPDAFFFDPGLVWQYYAHKRRQASRARPNAGHRVLAEMSKSRADFITITQNDDGLHQRAGHDPDKLHEVQGNVFEAKCTSFTCTYRGGGALTGELEKMEDLDGTGAPGTAGSAPSTGSTADSTGDSTGDSTAVDEHGTAGLAHLWGYSGASGAGEEKLHRVQALDADQLPKCPVCNTLLRPAVVWFGESLPLSVLDDVDDFLQQGVDLILVVGTSCSTYPANSYVESVRLRGGRVAVFNTDIEEDVLEGKVPGVWGFLGNAADTLPRLCGLDQ